MSETVPEPRPEAEIPAYRNWKFWAGSIVSLAAILAVGYWAWNAFNASPLGFSNPVPSPADLTPAGQTVELAGELPSVSGSRYSVDIIRTVNPHTNMPERGSSWVTEYVVQKGDSLSSIALKFKLNWTTILFGNTETLGDDPNFLFPGQVLYILPVDGAFYQWKEKDTLESVADYFSLEKKNVPVIMDAIINWPGNNINPLDPVILPGTWVIIPGGRRPFVWEAPMISTGGTTRTFAFGPGVCPGKYNGAPGTDAWAWPTTNHNLSGYDFGEGHYGIDIQVYLGQPIYSAQAGVVVFAGWSDRGYGNLVIVDHLNRWHTFYAHLSQWNVHCGQQVYAGSILGLGGSTGKSTGPHLHFEMRYNGVGQNPWGLLPP